jgi:hypothetical protein
MIALLDDSAAAAAAVWAASWDLTRPPRKGARPAASAGAFHEVFGNPFRRVKLSPVQRAWNDATLPKLAEAIYEERAFDRLPVLADALEDAGCTDDELLAHCRGPGPHARGCWALDLILGKG